MDFISWLKHPNIGISIIEKSTLTNVKILEKNLLYLFLNNL